MEHQEDWMNSYLTDRDELRHMNELAALDASQKFYQVTINSPGERGPKSGDPNSQRMIPFSNTSINDFKHVLYNLLVENHNDPTTCTLVQPYSSIDDKTK